MSTQQSDFSTALYNRMNTVGEAIASSRYSIHLEETGFIKSISNGIAIVSGIHGCGFEECVDFPEDISGIAFNIDKNETGVVLLGDNKKLKAGMEVKRSGRLIDIAVGDQCIGRIIDPLGRPLDNSGILKTTDRLPIERPSPPIMHRSPVTVPLQTGIKVIDAMIPIGRGQRELILGDRQTGKTAIAIDTIINQKDQNVICVYCAIGQRASAVAKVVAKLRETGALDYSVVMATNGDDPPGLIYIAPYAATSIAEYFMESGKDVLIIYDDLTHHARAYREVSLLLRRPPGREAFPGDIFYIHSRLLERSTHLQKEYGGGSLTALPIVETEAQDISSYIPTNLISITDGQIYLSPTLFELGILPAVDAGRSVSRVGGKAQYATYRNVAGDLKLAYAQFEELESFSRFGARLDNATLKVLEHGKRIRECLKQKECSPVSVTAQILILLALNNNIFDNYEIKELTSIENLIIDISRTIPDNLKIKLLGKSAVNDDDKNYLLTLIKEKSASVFSGT
jgi:F-type H+-transporting ATPase subunit alpha